MRTGSQEKLSRRERQIMEVVWADGKATAGEVLARLPDPPSYSAVRALLRVLENKGHLRHVLEGTRYVYLPTVPVERAKKTAMKRLLATFFDGSAEKAVATLLSISKDEIGEDELARMAKLIESARKEGR